MTRRDLCGQGFPAGRGSVAGRWVWSAGGVLLARIRAQAPPGAYVSLLADPPGRRLYQRHGFTETAPGSVGMAQLLG